MPAVRPLAPETFIALEEAISNLKDVTNELCSLFHNNFFVSTGMIGTYRRFMFKKLHRILYDLDMVFGANVLALRNCQFNSDD